MGFLWDWSKIIIVAMTILGLTLNGYIGPVAAALLMILYVMFRGAVRGSGGITKVALWVFEISFIVLLLLNVLAKGGGVFNLIPLVIELYSAAAAWLLELILEGHIGIYHGVFFILAIFVLERIGRYIGNIGVHLAMRRTFLIGVPIAVIIVFVSLYGGGAVPALLGQLLPLLMLLFGFYIIFIGFASSRRKH